MMATTDGLQRRVWRVRMSIHEGPIAVGDRVVVWTFSSEPYRATVVDKAAPTKKGFNAWKVKPDHGQARVVSCYSICQNLKPNR